VVVHERGGRAGGLGDVGDRDRVVRRPPERRRRHGEQLGTARRRRHPAARAGRVPRRGHAADPEAIVELYREHGGDLEQLWERHGISGPYLAARREEALSRLDTYRTGAQPADG